MKKRIEYIDLAKGICIFLIVIQHVTYYYHIEYPFKRMIESCTLPLFFFLSGIFFKEYGGFLDFFIRKTNKLLVPFVAFFILTVLLQDLIFNGGLGGYSLCVNCCCTNVFITIMPFGFCHACLKWVCCSICCINI